MAVDYQTNEHKGREPEIVDEEEDYIDMEVSSFTHFFPNIATMSSSSSSSPQHPREFEFHTMSSTNVERDNTTSPADELFYKGKLLPLHLPPRLQMVEKLLQDSPSPSRFDKFNETYSTPIGTDSANTPTMSSPFMSCNISPVESCQVSRELNREEYFAVCGMIHTEDDQKGLFTKKSWTKKLKTKIKSLFGKSGCSDEVLASKNEESYKEIKVTKKQPFVHIPSIVSKDVKDENVCHRRSFSGAFKRRSSSTTKLSSSSSSGSSSSSSSSSSSTSSSNSSNNSINLQPLKKSNSSKSEIETSLIQGAISHCKQSQQNISRSRKTLSEIGSHSFPSRFTVFDDQTSSTGLCRG